MANAPYIPAKDALFAAWLLNFSTLLTASPVTYGLTAPDAVTVAGVNGTFQAAYATATNPATRTSGAVAATDVARLDAEAIVPVDDPWLVCSTHLCEQLEGRPDSGNKKRRIAIHRRGVCIHT